MKLEIGTTEGALPQTAQDQMSNRMKFLKYRTYRLVPETPEEEAELNQAATNKSVANYNHDNRTLLMGIGEEVRRI